MNVKTSTDLLIAIHPVAPDHVGYDESQDEWHLGFEKPESEMDYVLLLDTEAITVLREYDRWYMNTHYHFIVVRFSEGA
jgi:hypothetical protein